MNARGAMEIILGVLALNAGIIGQRLFVALVVMALVTAMMSCYALQRTFDHKRAISFLHFLSAKTFFPKMIQSRGEEVLSTLASAAAEVAGIESAAVVEQILLRQGIAPRGLNFGIAIAHAKFSKVTQPVVAMGIVEDGVEFDAPDGSISTVVLVVLLPENNSDAGLEILQDIQERFSGPEITRQVTNHVQSITQLLALMKMEAAENKYSAVPLASNGA